MKTKYRPPSPEKRCTHIYPDGRQCKNWRCPNYTTCAPHTPELRGKPSVELLANNKNHYKNGTKSRSLKPLKKQEDVIDHLTIRHYEIYLAAGEEENIVDLARLSTELTRNALRLTRNLKK